jgi:hypothetical protein
VSLGSGDGRWAPFRAAAPVVPSHLCPTIEWREKTSVEQSALLHWEQRSSNPCPALPRLSRPRPVSVAAAATSPKQVYAHVLYGTLHGHHLGHRLVILDSPKKSLACRSPSLPWPVSWVIVRACVLRYLASGHGARPVFAVAVSGLRLSLGERLLWVLFGASRARKSRDSVPFVPTLEAPPSESFRMLNKKSSFPKTSESGANPWPVSCHKRRLRKTPAERPSIRNARRLASQPLPSPCFFPTPEAKFIPLLFFDRGFPRTPTPQWSRYLALTCGYLPHTSRYTFSHALPLFRVECVCHGAG